jgi:hypothetical protein
VSAVQNVAIDTIAELLRARSSQWKGEKFDVSLNYLNFDEPTHYPTICVVIADEQVLGSTLQNIQCSGSIELVIYLKQETDLRRSLHDVIQFVYETMLSADNALRGQGVTKVSYQGYSADQATTAAKPHTQAVMKYTFMHFRSAVLS